MYDFDKIIDRRKYHSIKYKNLDDEYLMMGTADMDFESATEIKEALIKKAQQGIYGYEFKTKEYYNSIINWYSRHYNWNIKQEWIYNSPGIWTGLRICIDTFTKKSDKILVNGPVFHPIHAIIEKSEREMVVNELVRKDNHYEIDFIDFEKQLQSGIKLFVLINPQNPTGRIFNYDELLKIAKLCLKYNVLIISDEVHGNITFDNNKFIPIASIDEKIAQNTITISSVSKAYNLQGLTYAYLIMPNKKHQEEYNNSLQGYDLDFATNIFSMSALQSAFDFGDEWLNELNKYLQKNLDFLQTFIEKNIPSIKVIRPEGSYLVWLDVSSLNLNADELEKLFIEKGKMYFSFESSFGLNDGNYLRLNFGCSRVILKRALDRIKELIQNDNE
ncbi:cystathionine beta-lyase [Bacilli bacterium PM5-9]|nr:cystathionine beta-lyase [Bacilli bacterium PM5-9]